MTNRDDTPPRKSYRGIGCLTAALIVILPSLWFARLGIATYQNCNACFAVEGTVVDVNGKIVPNALICGMSSVMPFPYTSTKYNSPVTKTNLGHFSLSADNVTDFELQATQLHVGASERYLVSQKVVPYTDWLGRMRYESQGVVLVLLPKSSTSPATSQTSNP